MWSVVRCQELWQTCQHFVFVHISHGSLFSSVSLEKKNMTPQQTIPPEGQNQVPLALPLSCQIQLGRKQRASRVATSDGSFSDALQFLLCTCSEQFINLGVVGNGIQHLINVFCKIQVDSASLNGTAEVTGFINWLAAQGGNAGFVLCILSGWEWINILGL